MTAYFNDITNQFNPRKVLLYSKDGQYFCESKKHEMKQTNLSTYVCQECKKIYMGPLMIR